MIPCRLERYCKEHDYPIQAWRVTDAVPNNSYYPIGMAKWCDYFDFIKVIHPDVLTKVRQGHFRLLIYSHEGDDPVRQQFWMQDLCHQYQLPSDCYRAVVGNVLARNDIENFVWFPDHELFYASANKQHAPCQTHCEVRSKDFVCLSRYHKWWRATAMTHLLKTGVIENSFYSYQLVGILTPENCIDIAQLGLSQQDIDCFVAGAPYLCDDLDPIEHNWHHSMYSKHFTDAYINIVLETMFDNRGAFLTEKTFKPIKHGQVFVIAGAPGTLEALRSLGYRTFDHVIDNRYDQIKDPTQRWLALHRLLNSLKSQGTGTVYERCRSDIEHNQELYQINKSHRLLDLATYLDRANIMH